MKDFLKFLAILLTGYGLYYLFGGISTAGSFDCPTEATSTIGCFYTNHARGIEHKQGYDTSGNFRYLP